MFIKLLCDSSCGFVKRLGVSEICVSWVVEENLPLEDASQITSLNAAIAKSHWGGSGGGRSGNDNMNSEGPVADYYPGGSRMATGSTEAITELVDFRRYAVIAPTSTEPLDPRRTPLALGLSADMTLRLVHTGEPMSLQKTVTPSDAFPTGVMPESLNTDDDTDDDPDAPYLSREMGWFPFLLRPRKAGHMVRISDPFAAVCASDVDPASQPLCESCGSLFSNVDALCVPVDRHYRPSHMRQDFMELFMEKLGSGPFPRWQARYVRISGVSLDWFAEEPRSGVKCRMHGHRYIVRNGACEVSSLHDNVDASQNPHCSDRNFYHFGVEFRDPRKTYWFRLGTSEKRAEVINFLHACVRRANERAPVRNPHMWKRGADALLANAAQLGELHALNRLGMGTLREEIRTLQLELEELMGEQPLPEQDTVKGEEKEEEAKKTALQIAFDAQVDVLKALRAELMEYEAERQHGKERIATAEARLAHETELLHAQRLTMGDEIHKITALRNYAMQQRGAAEGNISELRQRVAALQAKENAIFSKWRAFEERHRQPQNQRHGGKQITRILSFAKGGAGVKRGSPRLSTDFAAAAAVQMALGRSTSLHQPRNISNVSQIPLYSPLRSLKYSTSRERTPQRTGGGEPTPL